MLNRSQKENHLLCIYVAHGCAAIGMVSQAVSARLWQMGYGKWDWRSALGYSCAAGNSTTYFGWLARKKLVTHISLAS